MFKLFKLFKLFRTEHGLTRVSWRSLVSPDDVLTRLTHRLSRLIPVLCFVVVVVFVAAAVTTFDIRPLLVGCVQEMPLIINILHSGLLTGFPRTLPASWWRVLAE